jgi:hypothetical protein
VVTVQIAGIPLIFTGFLSLFEDRKFRHILTRVEGVSSSPHTVPTSALLANLPKARLAGILGNPPCALGREF